MATRALAHFSPPWVTRIGVVIVRRQRWIWILLTLAALVFAARAVTGSRGELLAGVSNLRRASWIWMVPAIAAECGAFIALARARRRILHGGCFNVSMGVLARLVDAAVLDLRPELPRDRLPRDRNGPALARVADRLRSRPVRSPAARYA